MWITNKLGYDITLSGVTLYKNSQQEISDADATTLNKDAVFTAMITAGTGLVKTDSQPDVNPQYFVRALDAPVTLDGMPTNPNGYPMVSPAQAFDIGKEEGGDADLENNKAVTIDVSDYTDPVEVTPTEGKDGMKKATVTLDNIPSGADLEANHAATINVGTYTDPVEIEPTSGKDGMEKVTVTLNNIPTATVLSAWKLESAVVYTKTAEPTTSDKAIVPASTGLSESVIASVAAEFASITIGESVYARYSDGDIEF